ncbi:MAG: putative Zn-dependent protease [Cryomorphaceae bacterium]|jgi:predicted Zn-dependent protease
MFTRPAIAALGLSLVLSVGVTRAQNDHFDQLPDLGSQASNFLSEVDAEKLGKAFIRHSRYQLPYISDPELVGYINRLGQRLLEVSEDAGKEYNFYLIDNNVINAFAVPGGHIAMHTGILIKSESESELASVIAHEISHVTQSHISRKLENTRFDSWLALGALLAAAAAGGADAAQAAFGVTNASIIDRQLTYSRSYETEADSLGIRLLSRAGFDTNAMPRFFKRLLDESRINESHAPEFLRSHPLTINRIAESAERVRAYPKAGPQNQDEFLLMQAKATAGYANDPEIVRDRYFADIKQGDDSLPTRYGYALALSQNGEFDKARTAIDALLSEYPKHVSIRLIQADNELEANKIDLGLAQLRSLYEEQTARGNHMIDIYFANALVLTKHNEEAIPILRSAIANNREEPFFHILLSRAYGETGQEMRSFHERGEYHYLRGNHEFSLKQFKRAQSLAESDYDKARLSARIEDVENELAELKNL